MLRFGAIAGGTVMLGLNDWKLGGLFLLGSVAYAAMTPKKSKPEDTTETIKPIEAAEGTDIGTKRFQSEPFVVSDKSLNTHMLVAGTTGGGKTVTVSNFVESFIRRGLPVIYIDGKGDRELAADIESFSRAQNRKYFGFAMMGDGCHYNPLASGGYSSKKDRLIELREWSEAHYRKLAEGYLQTVFKILAACEVEIDLLTAAEYLDRGKLIALLRQHHAKIGQEAAQELIEELQDQEQAEKNIESLKAEIRNLARSEIGAKFKTGHGEALSLTEVIKSAGVAYISLSPLNFPALSDVLGKLVINDLKASLDPQNPRKLLLVVDEFTTLAGQQVLNILNQGRSMGIHAIITVQSLADLGQKIERNSQLFVEQVLANCNLYLVHRMNTATDAETLAGAIGTKASFEITTQLGEEGATGMGSARRTRAFLAHPDEIKALRQGEAFYTDKTQGVFARLSIRKSSLNGD